MTLRQCYLIHKWTSLICTLFMLLACITGLPLIFHDELEGALDHRTALSPVPEGLVPPSIDEIVADVLALHPGMVVQSVSFEIDRPVVSLVTAPNVDSEFSEAQVTNIDQRTGELVGSPPVDEGILWFLEELHIRLFMDLPGTFFLGAMGVLFVIAIVTGVVLYAPFMRKLDFGTVRSHGSLRLKWLDLHNLLGIAITAWLLVVAVTGVFNTLDVPLANQFRNGQLAEMTAPYVNAPPLSSLGSLDVAIAAANDASPGMEPATIAYPGTFFGTPHHYNVFMRGDSPVTERLLKPTLVDAQTGELTETRDMDLHIRALFLSRPLHYGDYGGLVLKLVWAAFDLIAIAVLLSGVYLWMQRWRSPRDARFRKIEMNAIKAVADS